LVPVNKAALPNVTDLQHTLNNVYAQAITDWVVEALPAISVTFPSGNMTHGGSNAVSVFNADQRAVIKAFETTGPMEKDALYLFFVADVKGKDGLIGGYMPLQRQAGFIYDVPNNELIAHELAHGAFNLRHTFSTEENAFIAAQNTTENLMDYKGGTELWMHQWKKIQSPDRVWLSFLEGEEEGEGKILKCYAPKPNFTPMYEAVDANTEGILSTLKPPEMRDGSPTQFCTITWYYHSGVEIC
jgi:hypothetical protein